MMIKTSDHLNDSLSMSFAASAVLQANAVDHTSNSFAKEFEKVEISAPKDTVDISSSNRRDNGIDNNGNREKRDRFSKDADDRIIENKGKEADAKEKPRDSQNNVEDKKNNDNNPNGEKTKGKNEESGAISNQNDSSKAKPKGDTATQDMKGILEEKLKQSKQIGEMKTGIKENFTEGKGMEKVMLDNLEAKGKGLSDKNTRNSADNTNNQEKTADVEVKTGDEAAEKKLMQEMDAGKAEKSTLQSAPKIDKKEPTQDNNGVNLLNDSSRTAQRNDFQAEVKKAANPSRLLEQYQELRERVTSSVENSIKMLMATNENKVNLQLQPPELGKVEVELTVKDNHVNAKINTENIAVKEVILNNLDQLKSNLEEQGIHISRLDVEVGGFKNHFDREFTGDSAGNGKGNGRGGNGETAREGFDYMAEKVKNLQPVTVFLGRSINCLC